jgi:hypothetical protein
MGATVLVEIDPVPTFDPAGRCPVVDEIGGHTTVENRKKLTNAAYDEHIRATKHPQMSSPRRVEVR